MGGLYVVDSRRFAAPSGMATRHLGNDMLINGERVGKSDLGGGKPSERDEDVWQRTLLQPTIIWSSGTFGPFQKLLTGLLSLSRQTNVPEVLRHSGIIFCIVPPTPLTSSQLLEGCAGSVLFMGNCFLALLEVSEAWRLRAINTLRRRLLVSFPRERISSGSDIHAKANIFIKDCIY